MLHRLQRDPVQPEAVGDSCFEGANRATEVKAVAYLRRQDLFALSHYSTNLLEIARDAAKLAR